MTLIHHCNLFGAGQRFLETTPTGPFTDATALGRNVLSLYPLPNNPVGPYGANTFTQVLPAGGSGNVFSFKLTHQLKPSHSLNARYNFTNDRRILPSVNGAIRSTLDSNTRSHNVSLILDSANLLNRANFGLPVRTIGAPGFGSAVDTVTPGRMVVLVVKSSF